MQYLSTTQEIYFFTYVHFFLYLLNVSSRHRALNINENKKNIRDNIFFYHLCNFGLTENMLAYTCSLFFLIKTNNDGSLGKARIQSKI